MAILFFSQPCLQQLQTLCLVRSSRILNKVSDFGYNKNYWKSIKTLLRLIVEPSIGIYLAGYTKTVLF